MLEDYFFLKKEIVAVNAAVVGTSKERWIALLEEEASLEQAKRIMSQHRFDILPVVNHNGGVKTYFQTKTWNNYELIEHKKIDYEDLISFQTPLHLVIKNFAQEQRSYYFLVNSDT
ncbi:MAG: hypothetical protein RI580_13215 [Halothece sp. Uz-M2-17]|nr:hypothetical protein [Halothece sp. Uz-M2-17]